MAIFFSRRTYNASKDAFNKHPSAITRYVSMPGKKPGAGGWKSVMCTQDEWLQNVRDAGGDKDIMIYVHGFNTDQKDMLDRMEKIEKNLKAQGYEGAVIGFDWPSDGTIFAYKKDKADAKTVAPFLVSDGILPLLSISPRPKIHLLAHSMGALVVLRAFSDFGDSAGPGTGAWKVAEVTFASADVDRTWLEQGAWGSLVLKHRSKRFTNYYSREDLVLDISEKIQNGGRERVGRDGMPELSASGHFDVRCDAQYLRDVKPSKQRQKYSHRWWFDNEGYFEDLHAVIKGEDVSSMSTRRAIAGTSDQELFT